MAGKKEKVGTVVETAQVKKVMSSATTLQEATNQMNADSEIKSVHITGSIQHLKRRSPNDPQFKGEKQVFAKGEKELFVVVEQRMKQLPETGNVTVSTN